MTDKLQRVFINSAACVVTNPCNEKRPALVKHDRPHSVPRRNGRLSWTIAYCSRPRKRPTASTTKLNRIVTVRWESEVYRQLLLCSNSSTCGLKKPGPHQQHCRSNIVEITNWQLCCLLLRHCCWCERGFRSSYNELVSFSTHNAAYGKTRFLIGLSLKKRKITYSRTPAERVM